MNFSNNIDFTQIDVDKLNEDDIQKIYKNLNDFNQPIYNFVIDYYKFLTTSKSYGTDFKLSAFEAHILKDIESIPKISASDLSKKWNISPSFVSQNISKLEKKGFISRELNEQNKRYYILNITEKGKLFNKAHEKYDVESIILTNKKLLEKYSNEEIKLLHNILIDYRKIISE